MIGVANSPPIVPAFVSVIVPPWKSSMRELLAARALDDFLDVLREIQNRLVLDVLHHRSRQTVVGLNGEADVEIVLVDDLLLLFVERGVEDRELLQRRDHRLHDERQIGHFDALLGADFLGLLAELHELGDVRFFDIGEMRGMIFRLAHLLGDLLAKAAERNALFRFTVAPCGAPGRVARPGDGTGRRPGALTAPVPRSRSSCITRPCGPVP